MQPLLLKSPPLLVTAVQVLLLMRDAVENWDEFSAANAIHGWDAASPPCTWGGITCSDDGTILTL